MNSILIGEQLEQAVRTIDVTWAVLPGKGLVRVVPTQGFSQGFALVTGVAHLAEQHNHHPEITLRHDEVELTLNSHEAGGVTDADIALAQAVDGMLSS